MERKGFFTPEQEKLLDDLYDGKGIIEALDGLAIRSVDNYGLEKLKAKIPPEYLDLVYEVIDQVFEALEPLAEKE